METIQAAEAKSRFSELISRAAAGERFIIQRGVLNLRSHAPADEEIAIAAISIGELTHGAYKSPASPWSNTPPW